MSEIVNFVALVKRPKEGGNNEFVKPRSVPNKDGEFAYFQFYILTTTSKKNQNGGYDTQYKEQKMICWNEKLAKKFEAEIAECEAILKAANREIRIHFVGTARLKNIKNILVNKGEGKQSYMIENLTYEVMDGGFIIKPRVDYNGGQATTYTVAGVETNTAATPPEAENNEQVDDDIPF